MDEVRTARYWIQVIPGEKAFHEQLSPLIPGLLLYPQAIPPGVKHLFLPADGRMLSKSQYPHLYAMVEGNFGENETEFRLPDTRQ